LAQNGQSIICTVHQPSAQLFREFDRILLLGPNGETHYFGEIKDMVLYFEKYGAPACSPGMNPADWVLNVTGSNVKSSSDQNWASIWRSSKERKQTKEQLTGMKAAGAELDHEKHDTTAQSNQFAASMATQILLVAKRSFVDYWRTPIYIWSRLFLCAGSVSGISTETPLFLG
jgi:ATP-binding cassette subfamily G (WHITE) protein 2 (PDR)